MPNRRQIREAVVQLLYARKSSSSAPASGDTQGPGEEIWDLIHDRAAIAYDRARVKVLTHLQQGRAASIKKMHASFLDASAAIEAADPSGKYVRQSLLIHENEVKWAEKMETLASLTKADIGNWRGSLEQLLLDSKKLRKARNELSEIISSFPPQQRDTILRTFEKLHTFDDRVEKVASPERFPEQRELEHLHAALAEMTSLREQAEEIAGKVEGSLEELDALIEPTAENYDIKRLSKVDLAIIRLGAYEITRDEDIPAAVAIDEAIELARAFSSNEAAGFVNGILDAIAKP